MNDELFQRFWLAGMRKCNKKKAKSLFNNLLKKQSDPELFTTKLVFDIQKRLDSNQFGFKAMHPTTYLNGERWNDEVITNDRTQGHERNERPNQTGRPSVVDRVKRVNAERERKRSGEVPGEGMGQTLAAVDGDLRPQAAQPVRGNDTGSLGDVIEGDYSRAD